MYPNLYYIFKDWFGVDWAPLKILNTFGLMVAIAFIAAAWVISSELRRKEKLGLLKFREEAIRVGEPASVTELLINGFIGFLFGYKLLGLIFSKPAEINPQEYIFSGAGSIWGGLLAGMLLAFLKWYEKNKQKLPQPEKRIVRIWPHDRVGDIVIIALVFGILGAKLFDSIEHLSDFLSDPIGQLLSPSGLTFYGGLILAAIAICWYAYRKGITIKHLVDSAAPALMIAYAIGRIGCQVAGDGDWGIFNSAYVSDEYGKVSVAAPGDYKANLQKNAAYFLEGKAPDTANRLVRITDRSWPSLDQVPNKAVKGPSFLPKWLFAYTYPKNVNADGILIPGDYDEHNRVLPQPVFPTPLYETLICGGMFILMWSLRRKIKLAWVMFGFYLILNGIERFMVETIRVNKLYDVMGILLSQAEIIAICLVLAGLGLIIYAKKSKL